MKLFTKEFLPVVLIAAAIALSPSFSLGEIEGGRPIEIRIEDILLVVLGLIWIVNFLISGRKKIEKPPLFFPILAWLGVGFFSLLTNWIFIHITLSRGFFYFLKEIEFFFLYFYLFYHIRNLDSVKFIIKVWIFLGLLNVGWVLYQIVVGLKWRHDYGPGAVGEIGAFPTGGFFLILFIFLFNILLYYYLDLPISKLKKGALILVTISPAVGVFGSASRTAFIGFLFALFLTFLFYFLKKKKEFKSFLIILILILLGTSFIVTIRETPFSGRLLNFRDFFWGISSEGPRANIWLSQLSDMTEYPLFLFFGLGKSVLLSAGGESHGQYVRNFIETGIIGSLIFLILFFAIVKKALQGFSLGKAPFLIGVSGGLLVTSLTMLFIFIPSDAFIVVRVGEIYWFFTALSLATQKIYANRH